MPEQKAYPPMKVLGSLLDEGSERCATVSTDTCPVCEQAVFQQKCKVICRSELCIYRIIYNCSEF